MKALAKSCCASWKTCGAEGESASLVQEYSSQPKYLHSSDDEAAKYVAQLNPLLFLLSLTAHLRSWPLTRNLTRRQAEYPFSDQSLTVFSQFCSCAETRLKKGAILPLQPSLSSLSFGECLTPVLHAPACIQTGQLVFIQWLLERPSTNSVSGAEHEKLF